MTTLQSLEVLLKARFNGVLTKGKHAENGQCCALEALSVFRGVRWTDNPEEVRSFDLRSLNDIDVLDDVRTKHLLPVLAAYDGSLDWPEERQKAVATALAIGVVKVLISDLEGLPAEIAKQCREAKTRQDAASAAWSARSATAAAYAAWSAASAATAAASAAWSVAYAAWSAAYAASAASAARYAAYAARERVFVAACKVWLDAAKILPES